jgi:hypothetical protein
MYLEQLGVQVDCVSGPATDNSAGIDYVQQRFGKPAANGREHPVELANRVESKLSIPVKVPDVPMSKHQKEVA